MNQESLNRGQEIVKQIQLKKALIEDLKNAKMHAVEVSACSNTKQLLRVRLDSDKYWHIFCDMHVLELTEQISELEKEFESL